jgi:AraC-like DNA-binding protein
LIEVPPNTVLSIASHSTVSCEALNAEKAWLLGYDERTKEILINFSFSLLCPITGVIKTTITQDQFSKIESVLLMIQQDITTESSIDNVSLLQVILIVQYLDHFISEGKTLRRIEHPVIKEFVRLIDQEYYLSHQIGYFAEKLAISLRNLNRIFKAGTVITPKQSLDYRINLEARKLLMQSDLSLKEIADLLGFSSIEYFHYFFRRHNGMTPVAYTESFPQGTREILKYTGQVDSNIPLAIHPPLAFRSKSVTANR